MRKLHFIWLLLSALLLAGACSRLEEQEAALNIYVRLPEEVSTKATTDWATLLARETRINDLKIWVFVNKYKDSSVPKGTLLGYLEPKQLNVVNGQVQKFTVPLNKEMASKIEKVDVYVLANAKAVQFNGVGQDATTADLDALVLSGTKFGISANGKPTNTSISETEGLPYSAVRKGLELTGTAPNLSVADVKLVRAVSKIQFVFSQIKVGDDTPVEFEITGLELDSGQIPEEEYLFNDSENLYKIGSSFVDQALTVTAPAKAEIVGSTSPGQYAYTSGDTEVYQKKIYDALTSVPPALTGCPPCYLRESSKTLSGKITYSVGGVAREPLVFKMSGTEIFSRNSSWVLYFYFNNTNMSLSASYSEWEFTNNHIITGN